eukprot:3255836-Rhodomonas_salina.1
MKRRGASLASEGAHDDPSLGLCAKDAWRQQLHTANTRGSAHERTWVGTHRPKMRMAAQREWKGLSGVVGGDG